MLMLCMNFKHTMAFFPKVYASKDLKKVLLLDKNRLQFLSCNACGRSSLQHLLDITKMSFFRLHLTCLWLRLQQKRRHPLPHFFEGNSNMKSLDISKENLMRRQTKHTSVPESFLGWLSPGHLDP